jgi:hypothetical protein
MTEPPRDFPSAPRFRLSATARDAMRVERQLEAIASRMRGVDTSLLLACIQCAMYRVRGQPDEPHANLANWRGIQ